MEDLHLFKKYNGDSHPSTYAFGRDWRAMELYMEDIGSPTPEDAVLDWYHEAGSAKYYFDHSMTDDEVLDWFHKTWREE